MLEINAASRSFQALGQVVRALTGSELDDPHVGQPEFYERILLHQGLDVRSALAEREDDASVTRDFSA